MKVKVFLLCRCRKLLMHYKDSWRVAIGVGIQQSQTKGHTPWGKLNLEDARSQSVPKCIQGHLLVLPGP